jgi:hypothetical protein
MAESKISYASKSSSAGRNLTLMIAFFTELLLSAAANSVTVRANRQLGSSGFGSGHDFYIAIHRQCNPLFVFAHARAHARVKTT